MTFQIFYTCKQVYAYQQWLTMYMHIVLECDVPILESVYSHPSTPLLIGLMRDFYCLCLHGRFDEAQKCWRFFSRLQGKDDIWLFWGSILPMLCGSRAKNKEDACAVYRLVDCQSLSHDEKITRFLVDVSSPAISHPRDASPERH